MNCFLVIVYAFNRCRGCFDIGEDDKGANGSNGKGFTGSESEQLIFIKSSRAMDQNAGKNEGEDSRQCSSLPRQAIPEHKTCGGSLMPDNTFSSRKFTGDEDR